MTNTGHLKRSSLCQNFRTILRSLTKGKTLKLKLLVHGLWESYLLQGHCLYLLSSYKNLQNSINKLTCEELFQIVVHTGDVRNQRPVTQACDLSTTLNPFLFLCDRTWTTARTSRQTLVSLLLFEFAKKTVLLVPDPVRVQKITRTVMLNFARTDRFHGHLSRPKRDNLSREIITRGHPEWSVYLWLPLLFWWHLYCFFILKNTTSTSADAVKFLWENNPQYF